LALGLGLGPPSYSGTPSRNVAGLNGLYGSSACPLPACCPLGDCHFQRVTASFWRDRPRSCPVAIRYHWHHLLRWFRRRSTTRFAHPALIGWLLYVINLKLMRAFRWRGQDGVAWGSHISQCGRTARQEKQEALTEDAGFLWRVFPRKRRYAELSYLLPLYLGLAVKTRCVGPSCWHALYMYHTTARTIGYAPVGHGHDLRQFFGRFTAQRASD